MRTTISLALISFFLAIASYLFAMGAGFNATFTMGWLAVFACATTGGSIICGTGAIATYLNVTAKADLRAQQIADASLKQIEAKPKDYDG